MARCSNNAALGMLGVNKLSDGSKLTFSVLTDLDTCTCANTRNYAVVDTTAETVYAYSPYRVPKDAFSCQPDKCRNTGTLFADIDAGTDGLETFGWVDFPFRYDATEYYAGILTMYVYASEPGTYTVDVRLGDIYDLGSDVTAGNWDTYTVSVEFEEPGFRTVVVDLGVAPNSEVGTGWTATTKGSVVRVRITGPADTAAEVGVSSICFHDSTDDFETNATIQVACVEDLSNEITLDPVDASCWGQGYDKSSLSLDLTLTAKKATGNYWMLNPLERKGDTTEGFRIASDEREVQSITYNGVTYGYVQFPDMYVQECGFVGASIADQCNVYDAELVRVNSPVPMNISERQFQVMDGTFTEELDAGTILVHESLIGLTIVVTYPKAAVVEEFIADDLNLNNRRVKMTYEMCQTDGSIIQYVYENVLLTSFPMNQSLTDESSWDFSFSIQRAGANQRFYTRYRIVE